MAAPAESRPWNSIISPTCGPTASRTAATSSTAAALASGCQIFPGRTEWVELQSPVTARHRGARLPGVFVGGARPAVPAVGVGGQPALAATAEQAIQRLATALADDVPHGDLDAADGRHHGRAALVLVADHAPDDGFDVKRITSEDASLDPLVQQGLDGLLLPFQRGFADAREPVIGGQPYEQVVAQAGVGHESLEPGDLHWPGNPRSMPSPGQP